jgi:hypothetical protein
LSFVDVGPSPAWLGVVAGISFGGLVVAAFASGYHLASHSPSDTRVALASASSEDSSSTAASSAAASDPIGADSAAFAPIPGRVAEPLVDRTRAVLLKAPGNGDVTDKLPAGRRVTISRESGDYLYVRYERDGKEHEGWTHRINIEREEP